MLIPLNIFDRGKSSGVEASDVNYQFPLRYRKTKVIGSLVSKI
jgi:hypothetical protein